MKQKQIIVFILLLALTGSLCPPSEAKSNSSLMAQASREVKNGQIEFALMRYRAILRNKPESKHTNKALFALGEYFFMHSNYEYAGDFFLQYVDSQKKSSKSLFALAYLLKIAQIKNDQALAQNYEQQIKSLYPQSFIFRDLKEYKYNSPLSRQHKAVYSIDQINFYVEDMSIAKIQY